MKKPYPFTVFSKDYFCISCGKPLKMNVILRKPDATHCYGCGKELWRTKQQGKPA